MTRNIMAAAVALALFQLGIEIQQRRERAFARAWSTTKVS